MEKTADDLSVMERTFIHAIHAGRSHEEALRLARYSPSQRALNILARPHVQAELARLRAESAARARITGDRALLELASIAFATPDDVFVQGPNGSPQMRDWDDIPQSAKSAISKVKVRRRYVPRRHGTGFEVQEDIELVWHPKTPAIDKLGIRLGLWKEEGSEEDRQRVEELYQAMHERIGEQVIDVTPPELELLEPVSEEDEDDYLRETD